MSEQGQTQNVPSGSEVQSIIIKCLKDENFKKKFLSDPKGTIESEYRYQLPDQLQIKVVEDTENSKCIVLPYISNSQELSDEELQALSGGFLFLVDEQRRQQAISQQQDYDSMQQILGRR